MRIDIPEDASSEPSGLNFIAEMDEVCPLSVNRSL
jgi:hypothetical protein